MNGTRADDLAGTGLIAKQRLVIPFWLLLIGALLGGLIRAAGVVLWLAARHPRIASVLVSVGLIYYYTGALGLLALSVAVLAGATGWALLWPASWAAVVMRPLLGWWRWQTHYRRRWYPAMDGSGLTVTTPDRVVYTPKVTRVTSTGVVDTLHVRLLYGHTPQDISDGAEGLRHSFGAHRVSVVTDAPGRIRVIFYARDPLRAPVKAITPASVPDLTALPVGLAEDGSTYLLHLAGRHVLVAGASGAGKGSVLWSIVRALCPGIASGLVRLHGVDPKGGMELFPGRALFTAYADEDPPQMVALLEQAVTEMTARKKRLKAKGARVFVPSTTDPLVVVIVDELAFLTSYTDKATKARVAQALQLLLSQGRAVGYSVLACLQDPRKEVLPFRDLFTYRIALRLAEDSHVDMVLGDGALERGAACHLIPASLPGVGFVHVDGAAEPVRVRFTWITDDDITAMARTWPAPPPGQPGQVIDLRDHTTPPYGTVPGPRHTPAAERTDGGEMA